ncbi:MAG TPA: hypothetical protein VHE33_18415 [Acidobacteriaceae bacterium]|nr:hypothetical protein [Acidobacteriaceae bacterium]
MEQVEKALRALNIVEDMTYIRSVRKNRIDGSNQFILIFEEPLAGRRARSPARCPELDAKPVVAIFGVLAAREE